MKKFKATIFAILCAAVGFAAVAQDAVTEAVQDAAVFAAPKFEPSALGAAKAAADTVKPGELTAADLFVSAPEEVIPSIDRSTRMDMLDYFNAGSTKASRNMFGGECAVRALSPQQITFTTSAVGETTISLLEHGGKPLVMVVNTVKTPGEDSQVRFYNAAWRPAGKGLFVVPGLDEWTRPEARDRREDLENAVPFMLVKMSYDPAARNLTLTNNVGTYLPEEVKELAGSSLHGSLTYHWDGKRFKRL